MDLTGTSNLTTPLAFASSFVGGSSYDVEHGEWVSHNNNNSSPFDDAYVSGQVSDEDGNMNAYYGIVTSYVMPTLLLLQWTWELFDNDDDDDSEAAFGWVVPIISIALFCILSPFYRKAAMGSVPALLLPIACLTIADTLVLFHKTVLAFSIMTAGLLAMVARVAVSRYYYATRGR